MHTWRQCSHFFYFGIIFSSSVPCPLSHEKTFVSKPCHFVGKSQILGQQKYFEILHYSSVTKTTKLIKHPIFGQNIQYMSKSCHVMGDFEILHSSYFLTPITQNSKIANFGRKSPNIPIFRHIMDVLRVFTAFVSSHQSHKTQKSQILVKFRQNTCNSST